MEPINIKGGRHVDARGTLCFINEFDMFQVRRFYTIEHLNTDVERGWRAHKSEQRWFSVCKGSFLVKLLKIDDWDAPSPNLQQTEFVLNESEHSVLHIPKGFASYLKANENFSKIIVFADSMQEDTGFDNYLFPTDYFIG